jgi:hypothetical protein
MPDVELSTGTVIRTENVSRAEFYPKDALRDYGCHFGGPEMRDCPFLFIEMRDGAQRVEGSEAETDAEALERAGVAVIRHPVEKFDRPL